MKLLQTIEITDNPKVKTSELMDKLRAKFDVYSYWDDKDLNKNFLAPKQKTTRSFAIKQESSDLKGNSWKQMQLSERKEDMMTFREYILFFIVYHKQTGKYPDEVGWTVFRDSLRSGRVACGGWRPYYRGVGFDWYGSDYVSPYIGARLAISPSTLAPLVPSATELPQELVINGVKYIKV